METIQRWSLTIDFHEPHRVNDFEIEEQDSIIQEAADRIRSMIENNSGLQHTLAEHGITLTMALGR